MKRLLLIPLFALLVGCSGCLSTNFTEFAKAMAGDEASLSIKVNTIYGTASFVRVGGGTNTIVTASPDGTISKKTP